MINYQNIKLLNKNGIEIPLLFTSNIIITDANSLSEISDDNLVLYGITNKNNNKIELTNLYLKSSAKFNEPRINNEFNLIIDDSIYKNAIKISCNTINDFNTLNVLSNSNSEKNTYFCLNKTDNLTFYVNDNVISDLLYPSLIFYGKLDLGQISTDLIETETIIPGFIINNEFKTINDNNYKITYNISEDSHFKFFSFNETTDEVLWEQVDDNIVNIAFVSNIEGIYEHKLFINVTNITTNETITIGQIDLTCEAIGEDERYKTLFNNFGLQEPYTYSKIFKDTDINEANPDWNYLNKKSKELFLSYDKIFPYVGTYKALINAVKYLGYDDIYFREWYKIINADENIEQGFLIDLNNISSSKLPNNAFFNNKKKLNKLSMHYKMTSESGEYDKYHIPIVKEVYQYSIDEVIIKLFALKRWLEKNIIGINCKIIDITGEGIVYEKINYFAYGLNMQNIIYDETLEINPSLKNTSECLIDGSANISITSFNNAEDSMISIEDFMNKKFNDEELKNGTLEYPYIKNFYVKAINKTSNAIINNKIVTDHSRDIWLNNGKIYLMHKDEKINSSVYVNNENNLLLLDNNIIYTTMNVRDNISATFKNPPIIQLRSGKILNINNINNVYGEIYTLILNDNNIITEMSYDNKIKSSIDYIYLSPNHNATFSYTQDNALYAPLFKFENYKIVTHNITDKKVERYEEDLNGSFYLNINTGKIFLDKIVTPEHDKHSLLSFYYDNNDGEQHIELISEYGKSFNYTPTKTYLYNINDISIYAFNYNRYHNINVNNTGDYDITVYANNTNGNILGKHISDKCHVYQNEPKINICTYNEKSVSANCIITNDVSCYIDINTDILYNNDSPYFRENLLISNLSYNNHEYVQYNNIAYALDNAHLNDTLNLFNISDFFEIIDINDNNVILKCTNSKNKLSVNDTIKIIIFDKIYNTASDEFSGEIESIENDDNNIIIKIINCSNDCIMAIEKAKMNYEQIISIINITEYNVDIDNIESNKLQSNIQIKDASECKFNIGNNIKLIYSFNDGKIYNMATFKIIDIYVNESNNIIYKLNNNFKLPVNDASIKIKIAPAHQAFVKYSIPIISGKHFKEGYSRIYTSYDKLYNYIDNTFSCNITKFDNINAFKMWNNDISIYNTSLYIHSNPVTLIKHDESYKNNIIVKVNPVDNNDISTYWSVYKVNTLNGTRDLLFEVLNDKMYLKPFENSLYDIISHSYDKHGNLISVEHPGIIETK